MYHHRETIELNKLTMMKQRKGLLLKGTKAYNQATTKLAFHSHDTSKDIKLLAIYCHPGACQTTQKLAHLYMLITLKYKK